MDDKKLAQQAAELMRRHLDGLELEENEANSGADLLANTPEGVFAIEIKSTRRRGVDDMKGRLATAVLQAQRYASPDAHPVVLLHAPRVRSRAVARLEEFMNEYAPGVGWGAWDERGAVYLRMPELGISVDEAGERAINEARKTTHNQRAFTDLNRWLLKILMLRDAPPGMWHDHEKYRSRIANPAELQRVAHIADEQPLSQAKAYQFARTFRDLGLLKWDRNQFEIPDRRRVFDQWYEEERQLREERYPVRPIFQQGADLEDIFSDVGPEVHYAIGGFEACWLHGVLHTNRRIPDVHIFQKPRHVVERLDLEDCPDHEAELYLIEKPYRESIQRGTVHVGALRVVDILQAALDAGRHAQRGREQAEYIIDEVLGWN
jgi:hypothetical protein